MDGCYISILFYRKAFFGLTQDLKEPFSTQQWDMGIYPMPISPNQNTTNFLEIEQRKIA